MTRRPRHPLWGRMAEFESPTALVAAAHKAHETGYRRVEAYSPFPIEALSEALHHHHHDRLPLIVTITFSGMRDLHFVRHPRRQIR